MSKGLVIIYSTGGDRGETLQLQYFFVVTLLRQVEFSKPPPTGKTRT